MKTFSLKLPQLMYVTHLTVDFQWREEEKSVHVNDRRTERERPIEALQTV